MGEEYKDAFLIFQVVEFLLHSVFRRIINIVNEGDFFTDKAVVGEEFY